MEKEHKEILKRAVEFIKKYDLNKKSLTVTRLRDIIESLNFCIVDYWRSIKNEPNVTVFLKRIGAENLAKEEKAFTYYKSDERYVFLCGDLTADDTLVVLLHELGHIRLNHLEPEGIISNTSVQREDEAFLFSLFVRVRCKKSRQIKMLRATAVIAVALVLTSYAALIFHYTVSKETITQDGQTIIQVGDTGIDAALRPHCYWTIGGEVFHLWTDCQHIRNSSTIYVGSVEESEKDTCCKTCYKKFCEHYISGSE